MDYNLDCVFCIDVSQGMAGIMDSVKQRVIDCLPTTIDIMQSFYKFITKVRAKVIKFRTYEDGRDSIQESQFFDLSEGKKGINKGSKGYFQFNRYINSLNAFGAKESNNALSALSLAIMSDWTREGEKRRHWIVMLTNSMAKSHLNYDNIINSNNHINLPNSLKELTEIWTSDDANKMQIAGCKLKNASKHLMLLAPQVYPWSEIYETWNSVIYYPTKAGEGLDDISLNDFVMSIVAS